MFRASGNKRNYTTLGLYPSPALVYSNWASQTTSCIYPPLPVGSKPEDRSQTAPPLGLYPPSSVALINDYGTVSLEEDYDQINKIIKQNLDINEIQVPLNMELGVDDTIVKFLRRINSYIIAKAKNC